MLGGGRGVRMVCAARVGSVDNHWGCFVILAPSFGLPAVPYFFLMTCLAVYVVIPAGTLLRLNTPALHRAAPPAGDSRQQ